MTRVVHYFKMELVKGQTEIFDRVGRKNFKTSLHTEPGTLVMLAGREKNPLNAHVFEVYADQAAYEAHRKSSQFQAYVDQVGQHVKKRELFDLKEEAFFEKEGTLKALDGQVLVRVQKVMTSGWFIEEFYESVMEQLPRAFQRSEELVGLYATTMLEDPRVWYFFEIYRIEKDKKPSTVRYLNGTMNMLNLKAVWKLESSFVVRQGITRKKWR